MKKDDRLIYSLFMAQQQLRTHIKTILAKKGVKVTLVQTGILFALQKRDGQTMTELSTVLGIDNSTATGLVDRLQKAGLVNRRPSQSDRRKYKIFMTAQGVAECKKAKPIIRQVNNEIKKGFSKNEMDAFKHVLKGIHDLASR